MKFNHEHSWINLCTHVIKNLFGHCNTLHGISAVFMLKVLRLQWVRVIKKHHKERIQTLHAFNFWLNEVEFRQVSIFYDKKSSAIVEFFILMYLVFVMVLLCTDYFEEKKQFTPPPPLKSCFASLFFLDALYTNRLCFSALRQKCCFTVCPV